MIAFLSLISKFENKKFVKSEKAYKNPLIKYLEASFCFRKVVNLQEIELNL
jgi:hypothetical protein